MTQVNYMKLFHGVSLVCILTISCLLPPEEIFIAIGILLFVYYIKNIVKELVTSELNDRAKAVEDELVQVLKLRFYALEVALFLLSTTPLNLIRHTAELTSAIKGQIAIFGAHQAVQLQDCLQRQILSQLSTLKEREELIRVVSYRETLLALKRETLKALQRDDYYRAILLEEGISTLLLSYQKKNLVYNTQLSALHSYTGVPLSVLNTAHTNAS